MLSPADMLVVGVAALLFFGPDQLPKVARRAGQVVREVQATSASFIHEMERAADESDHRTPYVPPEPYAPQPETVTIDQAAHGTTEHDTPLAPDHDRHVTSDLDSHATMPHDPQAIIDHEPATMNGEPHATIAHKPQGAISHDPAAVNGESHAIVGNVDVKLPSEVDHGSTEVKSPPSEPHDPGAAS